MTQIPGDPHSTDGDRLRGVFWTKPDSTGEEVQREKDVDERVGIAQKKNVGMREALAKVWGLGEGKNPFEKKDMTKETKDGKTMTGQKPTAVKVNPKIEGK